MFSSIGFFVTLPEDVERFAPVARRLPGASFLMPLDPWPGGGGDSRIWTDRLLTRYGRRPIVVPGANVDLLVHSAESRRWPLSPWLAAGGRCLGWWEMGAPDPCLEVAREVGAASRARAALGLSGAQRLIWVLSPRDPQRLARFGPALAALPQNVHTAIHCHSRYLLAHGDLPVCLTGPQITTLRGEASAGELLAATDLILLDSGEGARWEWASVALEQGVPVVLLGEHPAPEPLGSLPRLIDPGGLADVVARTSRAPSPGPRTEGLDGARRLASALRGLTVI